MNSLEELGEKVEILAEAANRHYDRAEKFKQLLIDIIQKQSDMHDYGHPMHTFDLDKIKLDNIFNELVVFFLTKISISLI